MTNTPNTQDPVQEVTNNLTSLVDHVDTIERVAQLVENHGAMLVFALVMGFLNAFLVFQIIRGKLVPFSVYQKAVDEADRLQKTMEKERESYMARLLTFMGGLKVEDNRNEGEGKQNDG